MSKRNIQMGYDLYFGMVPVGTTSVKVNPIKNKYEDVVKFYVTRTSAINSIYQVFDVKKKEATIKSGENFNLRISYTPNIPGSKDFDYFTITDSKKNVYRLTFRGECIGPSVSCSIRNLTFFQTPSSNSTKEVIVLKNVSTVPALFQFDCPNEENSVFTVEPIQGNIAPEKKIYISVRFFPKQATIYSRQLHCLILHHEPYTFNLLGICSTTDTYDPSIPLRYYPFPFEETVGCKGYLSDCVNLKKFPPPFSLSNNDLHFGNIPQRNICQILTTSVTNHTDRPITVEWESTNLFKIYPAILEIPAKQSAVFECTFVTDEDEKIAASTISGHVSWTHWDDASHSSLNVPIPINLRLIAHSFPTSRLWIASVNVVPNNVVLPLTLPKIPSWTTFLIQTVGRLPILYKLIPPDETNFIMKPMVGLIRNFQIVVVQLESKSSKPTTYSEKWGIEVNGTSNRATFFVKAQTDVPRVVVGEDNVIQFDPMQPGTKGSMLVRIRNISSCYLEYEFQALENFGINPSKDTLGPFEEVLTSTYYQSESDENDSQEEAVMCQVQFISNDKAQIGELYKIPVKVVVKVIYSELCAFPHSHQTGLVKHGTRIKTCFYLFNFGYSYVLFKLYHNDVPSHVKLSPEIGVCGPREKILITVKFTVKRLGKNELIISYKNRMDSCIHAMVQINDPQKAIFRLEYEGIFPTFQIVNLEKHNFGHLFSNDDLWGFLKIDQINSALLETVPGEIRRVDLQVPEYQVSDELFYMVFSIESVNIPTSFTLKRRQMCDCKLKEIDANFNMRIKVFDCPHREQLSIDASSSILQLRTLEKLTFKIKYTFPNQQKMSYTIELSNERTLLLNIFIEGIVPYDSLLSVYDKSFVLNMGHVFIGLREAPIFAFWLYNPSKKSVIFKVDDLRIVKLCNLEDFPVLRCLNCEGSIKPKASAPILFKFWPIEVKRYGVLVPVLLGTKEVILHVEGRGTTHVDKSKFEKFTHVSSKTIQNNQMSLTVDRLMIEPVLVGSSTKRMFFIKNLSKNMQMQYKWKSCSLAGLVKIEPLCPIGILEPKESHSVIIKITSHHEPCRLRMLLCCEFVDNKCLTTYQTAPSEAERSAFGEFTITENAMKIEIKTPPPVPEYLYISLPIFINIVGISDRDSCVSAKDQMKQRPFDTIDFDVNKFIKEYSGKTQVKERPIRSLSKEEYKNTQADFQFVDEETIKSAIEHIASDAVFSDYFREVVENLKKEPNPLYSQIQLDISERDQQRAKEVKDLLTRPKISQVDNFCEEVLVDSLHNTFRLGPVIRSRPKKDDSFL